MTYTVFTSNQPRHLALLQRLSHRDVIHAVIEPKSFAPGTGPVMQRYWTKVQSAERVGFPPTRPAYEMTCVAMGDVSKLGPEWFVERSLLSADRFIVFGSSYITGWLAHFLIALGCLNLHGGLAPYYRGAAPNFWAAYDGRREYVGAQVQRLSKGLDAGEILATTMPGMFADGDTFLSGMQAIKAGHDLMVDLLQSPEPWKPVMDNDRTLEIAYHRAADFTEAHAEKML